MNPGKNLHIGCKSAEIPRSKPTIQHIGDSFLARFFPMPENAQLYFFKLRITSHSRQKLW